jgi:hypothetical protein
MAKSLDDVEASSDVIPAEATGRVARVARAGTQ